MKSSLSKKALVILLSVSAVQCGKKSKDNSSSTPVLENVSLDKLPNVASFVASDEAAALALSGVEGTVPKMADLDNSPDTYFYNGAVAAVNTAGSATEAQREDLKLGDAVCRLAQNNADTFNQLLGGTLCYMRNIPGLASGSFTVEKESTTVTAADYSKIFAQEDEDKTVAVKMHQGNPNQIKMVAHIKILGKKTSPSSYGVKFFMCESSDGQNFSSHEFESYDVNTSTGVYTRKNEGVHQSDDGTSTRTSTVSAYLKEVSGKFMFDFAKDRSITSEHNDTYSHSNKTYENVGKQSIVIDSNSKVTSKMYYLHNEQGKTNKDSELIWSASNISGAGEDIKMPEAAMRMKRTWYNNSQSESFEDGGAVEWKNTKYADTTTSDLFNEFNAFAFSGDSFYEAEPTAPTVDLASNSEIDCNRTPDVAILWDMTSSSFQTVDGECGGGQDSPLDLNRMCNSDTIQSAFQKAYSN